MRHYKNTASLVNRGRALETIVIASMGRIIHVDKFNAEIRFTSKSERARGKPAATAMKGKVDFVGEVYGSGRAIHFDAKQTDKPKGFYRGYLSASQELYLHLHGAAGAICGVLIEATHPELAAYYWLDWRTLSKYWNATADIYPWDMMTRLGDNLHNIPFVKVPGVADAMKT